MKLIGLSIEGLRKIKAAEMDFNGKSLVQVRGENGAGKSTVIDAIKYLLKGTREIPSGVVSSGAEESVIVGRIDDYIVRRVIKKDGKSALSIEREGGKMARPQEFLDAISGQFLDPEWFLGLTPADMRATVVRYAGIDFKEIDAKIASAEEERTLRGRELKAVGTPAPVDPAESVSMADLLAKRKEITDWNEKQDRIAQSVTKIVQEVRAEIIRCFDDKDTIDGIRAALQSGAAIFKHRLVDMTLVMPSEKKSCVDIETQISNSEAQNAKARQYQAYLEAVERRKVCEKAYADAQALVDKLRQDRVDMMASAHVPIKGLEITETGLMYKGASCENWSMSESLKIALMLAAAYSGDLRTVYIKRGEAFDSDSLASIKAFAEKHDIQIIMEVVDDSYDCEADGVIWLEEGNVVKAKAVQE